MPFVLLLNSYCGNSYGNVTPSGTQEVQVTGIVPDADTASPLAGVYGRIKGKFLGTSTDTEGRFHKRHGSQGGLQPQWRHINRWCASQFAGKSMIANDIIQLVEGHSGAEMQPVEVLALPSAQFCSGFCLSPQQPKIDTFILAARLQQ